MSNGTVSVNMKTFQNVVSKFSPNRSIMVTGRPGIGKSQGVYQISAKLRSDKYLDFDYCKSATEDLTKEASVKKRMKKFFAKNPVEEGRKDKYEDYRPSSDYPHGVWHFDMGLPVIERRLSQLTEGDTTGLPAMGKYGTVFRPCEWLFLAVHHPVTLFLDELNRAMKPVEQATFQLADSHAFLRCNALTVPTMPSAIGPITASALRRARPQRARGAGRPGPAADRTAGRTVRARSGRAAGR